MNSTKLQPGDKIRMRRVEVRPGQFLGVSGFTGTVVEVSPVPMSVDGGPLERYVTVDLDWPTTVEPHRDSFPTSWVESRQN